jgi:hypothetical protein
MADQSPVERLRQRSAQYAELADWASSFSIAKREIHYRSAYGMVLIEIETEADKKLRIDIGLGVFLEMTSSEAAVFGEKESKFFTEKADRIEQEKAQQAAIDMAIERVREWSTKQGQTTS